MRIRILTDIEMLWCRCGIGGGPVLEQYTCIIVIFIFRIEDTKTFHPPQTLSPNTPLRLEGDGCLRAKLVRILRLTGRTPPAHAMAAARYLKAPRPQKFHESWKRLTRLLPGTRYVTDALLVYRTGNQTEGTNSVTLYTLRSFTKQSTRQTVHNNAILHTLGTKKRGLQTDCALWLKYVNGWYVVILEWRESTWRKHRLYSWPCFASGRNISFGNDNIQYLWACPKCGKLGTRFSYVCYDSALREDTPTDYKTLGEIRMPRKMLNNVWSIVSLLTRCGVLESFCWKFRPLSKPSSKPSPSRNGWFIWTAFWSFRQRIGIRRPGTLPAPLRTC